MGVGNAIIGALRVVLGAETAAFEDGLKNANRSLSSFAASAMRHGAAVGAAITAAATAVAYAMQRTITHADEMGKAAQRIGIPVEELSRLRHAADLSGVAFEGLQTAISRFSRNITESVSDAQSTSARAFAAIGVSAMDAAGQIRPTTAILADVAERFSLMQDSAGKTALAIALFGRQGAELIPLLNQGRAGLNDMMREADELGIVLSRRTALAAEEFNDTLTRISRIGSGMMIRAMEVMLPLLQSIANAMKAASQDTYRMQVALGILDTVMKTLITTGTVIKAVFEAVGKAVGAVAAAVMLIIEGQFSAALAILREGFSDISQGARQAAADIQGIWSGIAEAVGKTGQAVALGAAPIIESANSIAAALRAARDHHRYMMDELINSKTETFTAKMAAAEDALRRNIITWQQFGQVVRRVREENIQHMHDLASATASALTTIFGKSKVAAIAAAVINTAQGITRNLANYPQPIAGIMAAITAASGAAQIAAIKSTNMGGGGSTPSASAGGGAAAAAGGAAGQTLTIDGLTPDSIISGASMRGIAERMIQFQRDGGEVFLRGA